jgi:predicted GNAT family acetyltransferase
MSVRPATIEDASQIARVHVDELYTAYLLRQYQRRGLGRRLLGAVARGLLADGKRSMLAQVLAENPSRPFYEAIGGKVLGGEEMEIGGAALEVEVYGWDDIRTLATFT